MTEKFSDYVQHGWKLCAIDRGSKSPRYTDWNTPARAIPADAADGLDGAGLMHAYSGTCAIDIDDLLKARPWFAERGVDIDALLADPQAVKLESGRKHRSKLIYRLSKPMRSIKPPGSGIELRCGTAAMQTVQDVLPPSVHPDTGKPYRWVYGDDLIGHWSDPPPLPTALLAIWRELAGREASPVDDRLHDRPQAPMEKIRQGIAILTARKNVDEYEDWIDVGMRIHDETRGSTAGFDLWDQWSKSSTTKYKGREDLVPHWLSFGEKTGPVKTLAPVLREIPADPNEFEIIVPEPTAEPDEALPKAKKQKAMELLENQLIYVAAVEKYFHLTRHELIMTESGMQNLFQAQMPADGRGGKMDPVKLLKLSKSKRIATRFGFHPGEGVLFDEDGERSANAYQNKFPPDAELPEVTQDDATRIDWMFGRIEDPVYRKWLLQFMAHIVQRPGVRILSAPLIWSKTTGNGKSTLLEVIPKLLVGKRYSKSVNSTLLGHAHNDYMLNTWHLCLPEFKAATQTERGSVVEMLKDWITADSITVHPKGTKAYTMPARFFITATSNHPDAIRIENDERRWAIHQLKALQMSREERGYIYDQFLSTPRAAGVLRRYFLSIDLEGFDPMAPAPQTADRQAMIDKSISPEVDALQSAIEEQLGPFGRDVVITREAADWLHKNSPARSITAQRVGSVLADTPFNGVAHQWRVKDQRYRGIILRNYNRWRTASGADIMAHLAEFDDPLLA